MKDKKTHPINPAINHTRVVIPAKAGIYWQMGGFHGDPGLRRDDGRLYILLPS